MNARAILLIDMQFDRHDYDGTLRSAAEVRALPLANLQGEYATIATTDQLLASF
jgi:hypothetical protein